MPEKQKFVFKGNRDYVQGTSMFDALVKAAADRGYCEGKINVSFKKMIHTPVCLLEQRDQAADDAVVARIQDMAGKQITLTLNEAEDVVDTERQEFDELAVCHGSVIGDRCITQEQPHHKDLIELLVSLCKKMHLECIDSSKKWVFSRYDGHYPIPTPDKVRLEIAKQVGNRLTCSDVYINNKKIGNIYFS